MVLPTTVTRDKLADAATIGIDDFPWRSVWTEISAVGHAVSVAVWFWGYARQRDCRLHIGQRIIHSGLVVGIKGLSDLPIPRVCFRQSLSHLLNVYNPVV